MKNTLVTAFLVVAVLLLTACQTIGSDTIVELPIGASLDGFTAVEISGPIETRVVPGSDYRVRITANENFADGIAYSVAGDTLSVSFQGYERILLIASWPRQNVNIDVEIELPTVRTVTARHGATVRMSEFPESEALALTSQHGATIDLPGSTTQNLTIHTSDAGTVGVRGSSVDLTIAATRGGRVNGELELSGTASLKAEHGSAVTLSGSTAALSGVLWHGADADLARMLAAAADIEAHHGSEASVAARESLVARATHGSVITLGTRPDSLTVHEEHGGRVDVTS